MNLKEQLLAGAMRASGCAEGIAQLDGVDTKEAMLQCFLDRIDFCLAQNFPTKEYLKRHFRKEIHAKGIYIDEEVRLQQGTIVLLGDCRGEFTAEDYQVARLYVKHTGRLTIRAAGHAFVMVDALDDTRVEIVAEEEARVVVNLYARAEAEANTPKGIRIIHKNRETYEL